jgi:hypothetical protein
VLWNRSRLIPVSLVFILVLAALLAPAPARAYDQEAYSACIDITIQKVGAYNDLTWEVTQFLLALPPEQRIESPLNAWLIANAFLSPLMAEEQRECLAAAEAAPPNSGMDASVYFTQVDVVPPPGFLFDFHPVSSFLEFLILDDIRKLTDPNAPAVDKAWALAGWLPWGRAAGVLKFGGEALGKLGQVTAKVLDAVPPEAQQQGRKAVNALLKQSEELRSTLLEVACQAASGADTLTLQANAGSCPGKGKLIILPTEEVFPRLPIHPEIEYIDEADRILDPLERLGAELWKESGYFSQALKARPELGRTADTTVIAIYDWDFTSFKEVANPAAKHIARTVKEKLGQTRNVMIDARSATEHVTGIQVTLSEETARKGLKTIAGMSHITEQIDLVRIVTDDFDIIGTYYDFRKKIKPPK